MSAATRKKRNPDPGTTCREWGARIAGGDLPRLLLLLPPSAGEEEIWFGEQLLAAGRAYGRSQEGLDMLDLDGSSPDFQPEVVDSFLNSKSLFASRQALILGRAAKALNRWPRLADAILNAATSSDGPEWMIVQAAGSTAKAMKSMAASRKKGIEKVRFRGLYGDPPPWKPDPDASEAAQFVATEARERDLQLQRGASGLLVELAGSRPGDLVQALEHFQMLGTSSIGEEEVRATTAHSAEGSAFDFADAVLAGDSAKTLRLLQQLSTHGLRSWDGRRIGARDAFSMILGAITRELRKTSAVLAAMSAGQGIEDALQAAGSRPSMPVVRRMEQRLQVADEAHLERVLRALVLAEEHVKMAGWRDSISALEFLAFQSLRRRIG
ncbi:MAG: DNA polymerase III subunit delta [Planctomycetota bacterium]|jgi:DNA polymerase III delta subunit